LDEPTSGVDTIARAQFWKLIKELKKKWGIAILVSTHYLSEAEYCDRVVLLKQGRKIVDNQVDMLHKQFPNTNNFEDIFLELYK
jgi:ribosome-dependent ATPase